MGGGGVTQAPQVLGAGRAQRRHIGIEQAPLLFLGSTEHKEAILSRHAAQGDAAPLLQGTEQAVLLQPHERLKRVFGGEQARPTGPSMQRREHRERWGREALEVGALLPGYGR